MKITLIQPRNEYWVKNFEGDGGVLKKPRYSLLNLLTVAAVLEQYEVQIIDERIDGIDFNEPRDLVGISVMTCDAPRAYEIADRFRKKGTKVVLGGIHPSVCQNEALEHCDAIAIGEAEYTWPQLIRDFQDETLKHIYKGERLIHLSQLKPMPREKLTKKVGYQMIQNVQTTRGR